jgi:hypothetical protein
VRPGVGRPWPPTTRPARPSPRRGSRLRHVPAQARLPSPSAAASPRSCAGRTPPASRRPAPPAPPRPRRRRRALPPTPRTPL